MRIENQFNEIDEVDFMLGSGEVAIEINGANRIDKRDMNELDTFVETYAPKRSIIVCNEKEKRVHDTVK